MDTRMLGGVSLRWPAVTVVIGGREHVADSGHYEDDDLVMDIRLERRDGWWIKSLEATARHPLPTPDYVEMDRQTVDDPGLRLCGYVDTDSLDARSRGEEESAGRIHGCGYPLIGDRIFTGLEHQAGFARIEARDGRLATYSLRHHPVWNGDRLATVTVVFGTADDPYAAFARYLEATRVPIPLEPFFAFCSFWSDPYVGNYEYQVTGEAMQAFIGAYRRLELRPDAFTFDAGWQRRRSFFEPKPGLEFDRYPDLSLWVSYNGPMGMDPEFLREQGIAVGGGLSSAYCGDDYGVLMDPKLEAAITDAFCRLARKNRLFKIDWDNECATAPAFAEKYPTPDHVREASINAMNRILAAVRKANPRILIRSGWWTSPWWLQHATHVFLSQSGDSEYASLPSLHQRSSAATHRDLMYYDHLRRDRAMVPLSSFDNHEFPNSIRNAFHDTDVTWTDNLMLCLLRGSTYFSWTVQPESLTAFRAAAMRQAMAFAREQAPHLFVPWGRMFGGDPGRGEVYGFLQPGPGGESWAVVRNPDALPRSWRLPEELGRAVQIYPCFQRPGPEILLLPEEVKVLVFSDQEKPLPFAIPFQAARDAAGRCECRFPSSLAVDADIHPLVAPLHRIPELKLEDAFWHADSLGASFTVQAPYRMQDLRIVFRIAGAEDLRVRAYSSRYRLEDPRHSSYAVPVTEIPRGFPGYGEVRNLPRDPAPPQQCFTFPIPADGRTSFALAFDRKLAPADLELWAVGFEPPSPGSLAADRPPLDFTGTLPLQHPLGFPRAVPCDAWNPAE